jgi:hypothetical protein
LQRSSRPPTSRHPKKIKLHEKLGALYRKEAYWVGVVASQYKKWGCLLHTSPIGSLNQLPNPISSHLLKPFLPCNLLFFGYPEEEAGNYSKSQ